MKLELTRYTAIKDDIRAYAKALGSAFAFPLPTATLWRLFSLTRADRAYDDSHPRYRGIKRVLPFDGSEFCSYYQQEGINDTHISTALNRINRELAAEAEAAYSEAAI